MSKAQERQRTRRLAAKGVDAEVNYDWTCHPDARIAAIALDDPERLQELIDQGKITQP